LPFPGSAPEAGLRWPEFLAPGKPLAPATAVAAGLAPRSQLRDSPGFAPGSSACAIVASASHRALSGRARRPTPIHWAARSRARRATRCPLRDVTRAGRNQARPPSPANLPRLRAVGAPGGTAHQNRVCPAL